MQIIFDLKNVAESAVIWRFKRQCYAHTVLDQQTESGRLSIAGTGFILYFRVLSNYTEFILFYYVWIVDINIIFFLSYVKNW